MSKVGINKLHRWPIFGAGLFWLTIAGCSQEDSSIKQTREEIAIAQADAAHRAETNAEKRSGTAAAPPPVATGALPDEVEKFVRQRDNCDHFRGEDAYNEERAKFLQKSLKETCTGTDARLQSLRDRYRSNPAVAQKLKEYEDSIE